MLNKYNISKHVYDICKHMSDGGNVCSYVRCRRFAREIDNL